MNPNTEFECTSYKHIGKGYILGKANIYVPKWGIELYDVMLMQKEGRRWINFPSREYTDKDGNKKFAQYFRFRNPEHMFLFGEQVKKAIETYCELNAIT